MAGGSGRVMGAKAVGDVRRVMGAKAVGDVRRVSGAVAGDIRRVSGVDATSSGDPLAALDRHVAGPLEDLVNALNQVGLDPNLLDLCAARIRQMVGAEVLETNTSSAMNDEEPAPVRAADDRRERAVLAFTEQYVLDAHGVTDELCAELNACLSPPELAALTTAIATFEALARSRVALGGVVS